MTDSAAIRTHDLGKRFGRTVALDGLSMTVERGEIFGFLGPNGAGKTTAVKLLLGLARPTSGSATVLGAPIGDRQARGRIGYLPELFRYQPWLTAREVLALHGRLAGLPSTQIGTGIASALALVGLAERGDDLVGTFSKGMQQRLGLGVALLGTPELVILDEPTSALDPVGRRDVRDIVRNARASGTAVFLNSHLLTEIERLCDRVAIVDRGRVVAAGRLDEILGEREVRVRATELSTATLAALERFGRVAVDGDTVTVAGAPADAVADIVAVLVRAGARVHAIDAGRETLEERFMALVAPGSAARQ